MGALSKLLCIATLASGCLGDDPDHMQPLDLDAVSSAKNHTTTITRGAPLTAADIAVTNDDFVTTENGKSYLHHFEIDGRETVAEICESGKLGPACTDL
jgi:hypothetical protein